MAILASPDNAGTSFVLTCAPPLQVQLRGGDTDRAISFQAVTQTLTLTSTTDQEPNPNHNGNDDADPAPNLHNMDRGCSTTGTTGTKDTTMPYTTYTKYTTYTAYTTYTTDTTDTTDTTYTTYTTCLHNMDRGCSARSMIVIGNDDGGWFIQ